MTELSTLVTRWILEWLEGHSISGADWVADICDLDDLIEPDGFIAWDSFAQLCDRLAEFSEERPDDGPLLPAPGIIGREIAIMGLRSIAALDHGTVPPSMWGKWKATVQFVAISLAILHLDVIVGPWRLDQWFMTAAVTVPFGRLSSKCTGLSFTPIAAHV